MSDTKSVVSKIQKQVDMLHYDLKIDLNINDKILNGIATITAIKINNQSFDLLSSSNSKLEPELEVNLYDNMKVTSLKVNGIVTEYLRDKNKLYINPAVELKDTFKIEIIYYGTPKRSGFDGFVFGNVNGQSLVYNISEPIYASTWFPCDDDPADKALLDIEITNDSQFVSVSNGNLIDVEAKGAKKNYYYKTVYPISTYLIAVYSAPYKSYFDVYKGLDGKDSMRIEYYVMPEHFYEAKIDFAEHLDMMKTLSELFGEYPFIKEKYGVAEFLWNFGAMENQTITGMGYAFIGGNNFYRDTYVHELSHHWWGNSVGPKTWNDIWLNEGFATYSEALYAEAKNGKDALKSKMLSKFSDNFTGTLYAPKDLFGETVYDKGAWVLHMLRYEIGDSNFFNSLHKYYDLYKYSNASVEDFKTVCENVCQRDLDKFFDQWVYTGTNNIFCSYNFSCLDQENQKGCVVDIIQQPQEYKEFNFSLEIQFQFSDGTSTFEKVFINKIKNEFAFNLDKKVETILLDPDSKLLGTFEKSYTR
ncbi:MAG: M1 family metallopeptidase [Ignavibacteriales bacterium]|nr:M1 family metallopeptidase [Ignavibacteriales bacterium]